MRGNPYLNIKTSNYNVIISALYLCIAQAAIRAKKIVMYIPIKMSILDFILPKSVHKV